MAPAIVMTPLNSTHHPMSTATTRSVGPGHVHTATPTPTSSSPRATDQPRREPSTGTLSIVKIPRRTNRTPTKTTRSPIVHLVNRMVPPATALMMPARSRTHQPRLTLSICSRVSGPELKGLVTITVPPCDEATKSTMTDRGPTGHHAVAPYQTSIRGDGDA